MISRVLVFDDEPDHKRRLKAGMEAVGCEVIAFDTHNIKSLINQEKIINFKPQLAIVDSMFESEIDGIEIVKHLNSTFSGILIVICTVLYDDPVKRNWIEQEYRKLTGVWAVIGKNPFPTGQQIIDLCKK